MPESEGNLSIFPNPSAGYVNVRTTNGEMLLQINVYSLTGQVLYHEKLGRAVNERLIDLKLSKGVYLLEVVTETSRINKQLILQ